MLKADLFWNRLFAKVSEQLVQAGIFRQDLRNERFVGSDGELAISVRNGEKVDFIWWWPFWLYRPITHSDYLLIFWSITRWCEKRLAEIYPIEKCDDVIRLNSKAY